MHSSSVDSAVAGAPVFCEASKLKALARGLRRKRNARPRKRRMLLLPGLKCSAWRAKVTWKQLPTAPSRDDSMDDRGPST